MWLKTKNNLNARLLCAGIAGPLVILLMLFLTTPQFSLLMFVVGGLLLREWFQLMKWDTRWCVVASVMFVLVWWYKPLTILLVIIDMLCIVMSLLMLAKHSQPHERYLQVPKLARFVGVLGYIIIIGFAKYLAGLHALGPMAVIAPVTALWVADSAAYFVGKYQGKTPLMPSVSPKKTWEGAVAAIVVAPVYMLVLHACGLITAGSNLTILWVGFLIALLGILGDLLESWVKRCAGVKDSGQLLPGHGGLLDRVDGWLVAIPLAPIVLILQ